jgi:formylmethanofuran dehydrogenase subunit E
MEMPAYFARIPHLRVQDPLARVLGSAKDGILEYSFADAVRVTGHACPTVAAAYWLTYLALENLYPACLPQRGSILVEFRDDARAGSNGVMATVVQMLTGAAGSSGFKGLGGRYSRAGLIRRRPDLLLLLRFTRMDTRAAVDVCADTTLLPMAPGLDALVSKVGAGRATSQEEVDLGILWQERVRHLLLEFARDPAVFVVRPVERQAVTSQVAATGTRRTS